MSNVNINQGTQTAIRTVTIGTADFQAVVVNQGTSSESFFNGSVAVTNIGTLPNLPGGTITLSNPTGTTVTVDHGTVTLSNPTGTTVTVDHGTITLSNPTGTTVQFNNGTLNAGTVIANAGTNLNTSALALETGGNLATLAGIVSASKAATKSADGDFVTIGAKADTAITDSTTTNTHMSFLKGLIKILADVWDSTNHLLGVKIGDGTNTVNVLKSDGSAAGQNAQLVAGTYLEKASLSAGSLNADLLPSTDVSNYKGMSVQILGTWSGTLSFQVSNDNTNWVAAPWANSININNGPSTTTISNGALTAPLSYRYIRIRMTSYNSGTATGIVELYTTQTAPNAIGIAGFVNQNGTWTVGSNSATGSAVPANAFYQGLSDGTNLRGETGNVDTAVLITASGATTTQTGADQTNFNSKGVKVVLDMTTVGTGSVTLEIDGKDAASGKYYAILTGAAVTTNSTNVYTIYPGVTVAANAAASDILPKVWRVKVTANNANAATYTVGASVIL